MNELRTVPVSRAVRECRTLANRALLLDYQPGNGTRYRLLFCPPVGPGVDDLDPTSCLVTLLGWDVPQPSAMLKSGGLLHHAYVAEKLGLGEPDARVVAEIAGLALGREYEGAGPDDAGSDAIAVAYFRQWRRTW